MDAYEVYYTPLLLVEAKWIILRLARRSPDLRERLLAEYRAGLETLEAEDRLHETITTNSAVDEVADKLLAMGVRDYFDRMIYATACYYNAVLLTEDRELHSLQNTRGAPKPPAVPSWEEILPRLR
ncbi:PIN domain-containing protein [Hyperthermus butylicus]|uniref:PIN domain-containing protein n=1 Tax=Hyperthermus butylicus TaxID=54248 RepID=UPI000A03532E|nr:PIN domain-containing protein [Hyperthermus butylicus]